MPGFVALATWLLSGEAWAHQGIAPILEVTDYSQLPDAPPGVWMDLSVHPSTVIGCALMAAFYLYAVGPLREKRGWAPSVSRRHIACFLGSMGVILLSLNGPIHHLSDNYLFSMHMVQHLLLTLVVPYLFILGLPGWLVEGLLGDGVLKALARAATRPVPAFLVYNMVLVIWHMPRFYDHTMESHPIHITEHLMFMVTAVVCWWPILGEAPSLKSLGMFGKMAYLFLLGLPMKALGAFITVAPDVLYSWYAHVPRVWGLDPIADQRLGGVIMWVPAGIVIWGSIGVMFVRWYRAETRGSAAPALSGSRS
ncbi:MAG: cytochrome c oxidase assembly protein [Alphaproteobacteria bacterium]|nr:cytochrome c oxidase assembly protein [Alphaproteobacteria bacterium]